MTKPSQRTVAQARRALDDDWACPDPDLVEIPDGCDPDSTTATNVNVCLPQAQMVFGVAVRAAADVPEWAFEYSWQVLAQYLDSDMDGEVDDPKLADAMSSETSGRLGFAVLKCRGSIGGGRLKDSMFSISRTQGQPSLDADSIFQQQTLEEMHHGIYHGLELAYPSVFLPNSGTELHTAIQDLKGNCEDAAVCVVEPDGCNHYTCQSEGDDSYRCQFIPDSCDGVYHYAEPSCGPGSCLVTEGFYHGWMAAYGYNCNDNPLESEWELCSQQDFSNHPKAAKLYALVTGNSPSASEYGYVMPSLLPNGVYDATFAPTISPAPTSEYDDRTPWEEFLDNFCFSGNMEVVVQGKGVVPMEALQVGDYVKIGKGETYEQVYAFGHRVPHKYTNFVQLHTIAGSPLEITSEHLVFVNGKTNPVRAGSIKVGDILQAEGNNAVVENVEVVIRSGIYNPLTSSGSIQVNGITASNYISFQKENNEYVELQGGMEIPLSHHDFAHRAMAPFRFYCTTLAICAVNDANSGLPVYVSKGMELVVWSKQQDIAIQFLLWASFRILILASILMTSSLFIIPTYLISAKFIRASVVWKSCVHFKQEMKKKIDDVVLGRKKSFTARKLQK